MDWEDKKHPVDIGDLDNIDAMFIKVVTGDEILHVLYKDEIGRASCRERV